MSDRKFPLFIDLADRSVAVFGGGKIALRRIKTLLEFDANIAVIAPEIRTEITELCKYHNNLSVFKRPYIPGDCDGKFMVLAATDDDAVNHEIVTAAHSLGIPANNASCRTDSDFFFPAVAFTDEITVGICGTGNDHSAVAQTAAAIRKTLSEGVQV